MLRKQSGFLTSSGDKVKNSPYVQELLDAIILPATLAIIQIPGHSKLDSLETKGNHLLTVQQKRSQLQPNLCHGPKGGFSE